MDEISITIAFALLGLTWLTLRGMDGREALGKIPRDFVKRTVPWALGAAALTFLVV